MNRLWDPWRLKFILEHRNVKGCVLCNLHKESKDAENLVLHRAEHCYVVFNRYPYNSGHLMVVPYEHTRDLETLGDPALLDVHRCIRESVKVLKKTMRPQGFNIGMNMGAAGGAGIEDHLHYHIVPRWTGDTNFMPVMGEVKVLPETLEDTYKRLRPEFSGLPKA